MEILIIAGPASVALDRARNLTNHSTGRTGVTLAKGLQNYRAHITLWYGVGAVHPLPEGLQGSERFDTLHDLESLLPRVDGKKFDAILLPAALPDYDYASAHDLAGNKLSRDKWPGHLEGVRLELKPAPRILNRVRALAPQAKIIGWKWEAEGNAGELLAAAREQIEECRTDACVLNGPGYGKGFLFIPRQGEPLPCGNAEELAAALAAFLNVA